jgi:hypothetical protein
VEPVTAGVRAPAATAFTTAADVHPAGVPEPMMWSGRLVSTARACAGTLVWPFGLPGRGSVAALLGVGVALGVGVGDGLAPADAAGTAVDVVGATKVGVAGRSGPQAASVAVASTAYALARRIRTAGC